MYVGIAERSIDVINRIQIVANKVYYNMSCVAFLNELAYGNDLLEFKELLIQLNEERNKNES